LAAAGGLFVGRDDLFYQLEAAAGRQRVVVLTGPGGTGKTEVARGFARWWRDTRGVDDPRLVLWHSFEPGVASFGLDGVIAGAGLAVFGPDFARLDQAGRLEAVRGLLGRFRVLLVWDNFETVREMPDPGGVTPPLDQAGRAELRAFVDWVRDRSRSAVIITSRAGEDWLGPAGLLVAIRGTTPLPAAGEGAGRGRMSSLGACITYSFAHLAQPSRRLLPAVSLFHGVADEDVLTFFSAVEGVPARFAGV